MSDSNSSEPSSIEFHSHSETQTIAFARELAQRVQPGDVVALVGDLGAGKTRFVRGLVEGLGFDASRVTSPTFILLQEYSHDHESVTLVHVDAYRLSHADELETIGWDELLADPNVIIAVEWAERIASHLPDDHLRIEISHQDGTNRTIILTPNGNSMRGRDWSVDLNSESQSKSKCPTCGKPADVNASVFPFCSERCRLVDLGNWLGGKYVVSREIDPDDDVSELD